MIDFYSPYCRIEIDTSKGVSILSIIFVLWLAFSGPHQQVAGINTAVTDPNHPVEVFYGSAEYTNTTDMLSALGATVYPEDKVEAVPPPEMNLGSKITVTRATPVLVTDAKKTYTYRTWTNNIGELLTEKNIELLGKDSVDPIVSTPLTYAMQIKITRVAEVEVTETESIDYKVIKKNSVDLEKGQTQIQTKGKDGSKDVLYLVKRVDGEEVSRSIKNTTVTLEPVDEVQIIGIGPKLAKSGPYLSTINNAAKKYLINGTALMCLMLKESGGSPNTGYPDGQYKGLFQYTDGYWASASAQAGYSGVSIYNAEAQIFTTAYQLTHGQSRRWPPWSSCSNL